jgi:hypothetical protein
MLQSMSREGQERRGVECRMSWRSLLTSDRGLKPNDFGRSRIPGSWVWISQLSLLIRVRRRGEVVGLMIRTPPGAASLPRHLKHINRRNIV